MPTDARDSDWVIRRPSRVIITAEESPKRMQAFPERKEQFIASICRRGRIKGFWKSSGVSLPTPLREAASVKADESRFSLFVSFSPSLYFFLMSFTVLCAVLLALCAPFLNG